MTVPGNDFTEANRKAFNDLSSSYNKYPWQQTLTSQISHALTSRLDWLDVAAWKNTQSPATNPDASATTTTKQQVRLLDYACGPGTITSALAPHCTSIVGIDLSENMVEAYNNAASSSELNAKAMVGNFLSDDENETHPELREFDLAVVSTALHHMDDPAMGVKKLAERVRREDGVVCVLDFMPFVHSHSQGGSHSHGHQHSHSHEHSGKEGKGKEFEEEDLPPMAHTIKKHGFTHEEMEGMFENAGLERFKWEELEEPLVLVRKDGKMEVRGFVARGTRKGLS